MKDYRYANRGQTLEHFITFANHQYRQAGKAVVWKVPTEFIPLRNYRGEVTGCKVNQKSCVDYLGRVGTRPIALEAKETRQNSIRFDAVQDHQADFLDDFTKKNAGMGAVVVSFNLNTFYTIPWEFWRAGREAWKRAQRERKRTAERITIELSNGRSWTTPGRASIKESELLPEWKVTSGGRYGLDYLKLEKGR